MKKKKTKKKNQCTGAGGAVYGIGLVGAAVYYVQQATSLGEGLLGLLKALAWPALLIYKVFGLLGM